MECDDDAGGREVPAVHQQGTSGEGKAGGKVRPLGAKQTEGLEPRASQWSPTRTDAWRPVAPPQPHSTGQDPGASLSSKRGWGTPSMTEAEFPTTSGERGLGAKLS